ncbi:hypothetical protein BJ166DRAFT_196040 [Pestalotiopsis sp. NC0098]|nr:hypothetical protein BJ166DRAFT_196040 [Pestalotiopsis sp. NC0098]
MFQSGLSICSLNFCYACLSHEKRQIRSSRTYDAAIIMSLLAFAASNRCKQCERHMCIANTYLHRVAAAESKPNGTSTLFFFLVSRCPLVIMTPALWIGGDGFKGPPGPPLVCTHQVQQAKNGWLAGLAGRARWLCECFGVWGPPRRAFG